MAVMPLLGFQLFGLRSCQSGPPRIYGQTQMEFRACERLPSLGAIDALSYDAYFGFPLNSLHSCQVSSSVHSISSQQQAPCAHQSLRFERASHLSHAAFSLDAIMAQSTWAIAGAMGFGCACKIARSSNTAGHARPGSASHAYCSQLPHGHHNTMVHITLLQRVYCQSGCRGGCLRCVCQGCIGTSANRSR